MVDALRVGLVKVVAASEVWREQNANATPASFLREQHTLDHRQAVSDVRAADSFAMYPQLARAARDGTLSRDKIDLILAFGLRNPERAKELPDFLDIFVEMSHRLTTSELRKALQMWADQIDPVTTGQDDANAHARRELHVSHFADGIKLDGFFGPEQGLRILAALNGALEAHWRANHRNEGDDQGAASPSTADARAADQSVGQRTNQGRVWAASRATAMQRADAFVAGIIDPILESGTLPTCGGAPASISVTIPLERLANPDDRETSDVVRLRMLEGSLKLYSGIARSNNGPGEFLVSARTAQRLSCDATVQRVLVSAAGKPLDIGRRTRVIPEQIRTALVIRDGGCQFPFCSRPAGWTEGHHIRHWSQGGETSLDNLILLCSRHHHVVHAEEIPITMNSAGIPRINPPPNPRLRQ
jgi:hypothetical protein